MKITSKMPEHSESLHLELIKKGWVPLKEPKNLFSAIFLSFPFMIINVPISIGIINLFHLVEHTGYHLAKLSIGQRDLRGNYWIFAKMDRMKRI